MAPGGGRDVRLALPQRAVSAQRSAAGPGGDGLFAADRAVLWRRARASEGGGSHAGFLPGADRGAHSLRNGARPVAGCFAPGERARQKVEDHTLGFYQALIEARIPFEMVHDRLLDASRMAPFKVLVLPNIAALSDQQCRQVREFVERGGSLVATHETSLYNEWGVHRADFGLADLFGAHFDGAMDARMINSYLRLETDPQTGKRHPILAGLENT